MSISRCRSCGSEDLAGFLDLGNQPPSNSFLRKEACAREVRYPLQLVFCAGCALVQLSHTVSPDEMFTDYVYLSSTSRQLLEHLQQMARTVYDTVQPPEDSLVVDIGCNDGALLSGYPVGACRLLGVEPSTVADIAQRRGLSVHRAFFNTQTALDIVQQHGQAHIVTATNVFAHIADQDDAICGLRTLLAPDGLFVIEVPYLDDMLEQNLFDTVYHEHIFYFSLHALDRLLRPRGLRIVDVQRFAFGPSGPPMRVAIAHADSRWAEQPAVVSLLAAEAAKGLETLAPYRAFAERVWLLRDKLHAVLDGLKAKGESLVGYGAPAKGNTILNTFHIGRDYLDCILERNPLKCGLLTPGMHIPVVDEETFDYSSARYALLLSWNLAEFFLQHSPFIKCSGRFVVPLPTPVIIP